MSSFAEEPYLSLLTWQGHERLVARLALAAGWTNVYRVGQSGDGGADVVADRGPRKWLFQVKKRRQPVNTSTLQETAQAVRRYQADIGVVVSRGGFTADAERWAKTQTPPLQLWGPEKLRRTAAQRLTGEHTDPPVTRWEGWELHRYQETAAHRIVEEWTADRHGRALVVLATGLGKTVVAAEAIRRISVLAPELRVLIIAHTKPLVNQLDEALWPFLRSDQASVVLTGDEQLAATDLERFQVVAATQQSLAARQANGEPAPAFDLVLVDECHHSQACTYASVLQWLGASDPDGPFLLGLTATPWRSDQQALGPLFGDPITQIDLVRALRSGYLANLDYRFFVDQVDWEQLRASQQEKATIEVINQRTFSDRWSDAVIDRIHEAWDELKQAGQEPRGIVFCKTVDHARRIAGRINALGFTRAEAIFSSTGSARMSAVERNSRLWDFRGGRLGILCAIDVLNEGIDVPSVNLVVFARVTHSRQIFIQQLGRGLRFAPGKKLIALDFVTDVRRAKAILDLDRGLANRNPIGGRGSSPNSTVVFMKHDHRDDAAKVFLEHWLGDTEDLEDAGEDASLLRFPDPAHLPPDR